MRFRAPALAAVILFLATLLGAVALGFAAGGATPADAPSPAADVPPRPVRDRLLDDLHYSANNVLEDVQDVIESPLHIPETVEPGGLLRSPGPYLTLLGAGALFGATFALDQTVRSHLHTMPSGRTTCRTSDNGRSTAAS